MVSFGGAACWLYLFPMGLAINSCMPDYTPHYCTYGSRDTKTYAGQPRMRRKLTLVMILMFVIIADIHYPHCLSAGPRFGKKDHQNWLKIPLLMQILAIFWEILTPQKVPFKVTGEKSNENRPQKWPFCGD